MREAVWGFLSDGALLQDSALCVLPSRSRLSRHWHQAICSVRPSPVEEFVATPAHGVWSETLSQGQLAGFSFNKALEK